MPTEPPHRKTGECPHPAHSLQLWGGGQSEALGPPVDSLAAGTLLLGPNVVAQVGRILLHIQQSSQLWGLSVCPQDYERNTRTILQVRLGFRKPF